MKTIEDYDQLPYADCPIKVSRPDNLYVIGRLFHLQPAPPERCKVLEIGCAGGANIIPLAYYWPHSEFVGVELSREQAAQANRVIQELQLSNIQVLHRDLTTLDQEFGRFDYIIAHGVYSWVPPKVQQRLLRLCKELLTPNGIAYVSYNTLPGWHPRNMLRDMMRYHARNEIAVNEQLAKSLEMLELLRQGLSAEGAVSERWLKLQAEELLHKPPNYVFHDYLERHNTPVYFHQFAGQLREHGLQYFAEASLYTMLSSTLTPEAENALDQFDDPIEYEQYMDFFYLKHFRQSLLCHADHESNRQINTDILQTAYFYSDLYIREDIDLFTESSQAFVSPQGDHYSVAHPLSKAALAELLMAYPTTLSVEDILQRAAETVRKYGDDKFASDVDALFKDLVNLYLSGAIDVSTTERLFAPDNSDRPQSNALSRAFCRHDKFSVPSIHHDSLALNAVQRKLIELADGIRNIEQISAQLSQALNEDSRLQDEFIHMLELMHLQDTSKTVDTQFVREAINSLANLGLLNDLQETRTVENSDTPNGS